MMGCVQACDNVQTFLMAHYEWAAFRLVKICRLFKWHIMNGLRSGLPQLADFTHFERAAIRLVAICRRF